VITQKIPGQGKNLAIDILQTGDLVKTTKRKNKTQSFEKLESISMQTRYLLRCTSEYQIFALGNT